jgi:glycerate kinase
LWDAKQKSVRTIDAAHRPLRARWWWEPNGKAAIIESAAVIGLAQLPPKRFHPFHLDTYGLGAVIRAASRQGVRRCVIGIGGSATNDGGFGLAVALGWQFLDAAGRKIEAWPDLNKLEHIVPPKRKKLFDRITVAVDVQNPLLGKNGATRIYGPQKGLRTRDFIKAEDSLRRLAHIVKRDLGLDLKGASGAGAAGGLGFGLAAFLGAHLEPGFHLFAREARLTTKLRQTDLVITGEGRLDASTAMGKGVGELARICRKLGIPCIGLAGEVVPTQKLKNFSQTAGMTDLTDVETAKRRPEVYLFQLAQLAAKLWVGCD